MSRDSMIRDLWIHEPRSGPDFAAFSRSCERLADIDLAARHHIAMAPRLPRVTSPVTSPVPVKQVSRQAMEAQRATTREVRRCRSCGYSESSRTRLNYYDLCRDCETSGVG